MRKLRGFLRNLVGRDALEHDLDEELDSYVELLQAENESTGLDRAAARRRALLELGGKESVKESVRDGRVGEPLRVFLGDLRFAVRLLAKNPGFAALVVSTLTLGVGFTTAVFSVAHGVLLRGIPYPEPDRLVYIWTHTNDGRRPLSPPDYVEFREQSCRPRCFRPPDTDPSPLVISRRWEPGSSPDAISNGRTSSRKSS